MGSNCAFSISQVPHKNKPDLALSIAGTQPDQTRQLNQRTALNSKKTALLAEGLNTCAKGKWHLGERPAHAQMMFPRHMFVYFRVFSHQF
jgi:arylsulfatase A-like enzyme